MAALRTRTTEDEDTFVQWMSEHRGIVVKIVRGFTDNRADEEDLTQDIAIAVWRSVGSFKAVSKPSTWIWRIALNQAISWQRSTKKAAVPLDKVAEPEVQDRTVDVVLLDQIYQALRTLSPLDRSLIMLSLEGMTYADIAELTGLTETNVGARLSRARTRLSIYLEESR